MLRRRLPGAIARARSDLSAKEPFERKVLVEAEPFGLEALAFDFAAPYRDALLEDARRWTRLFLDISGATALSASLTLTRSDECPRFHVDWVELRLLLTYVGPGAEWVRNSAVHREALRRESDDMARANAAIVTDPSAIRRAQPGDVLLLKGEAYPGNQGRGAVHRSPPIKGTGMHRLVFKLTTA
jgi:hypothetical protein